MLFSMAPFAGTLLKRSTIQLLQARFTLQASEVRKCSLNPCAAHCALSSDRESLDPPLMRQLWHLACKLPDERVIYYQTSDADLARLLHFLGVHMKVRIQVSAVVALFCLSAPTVAPATTSADIADQLQNFVKERLSSTGMNVQRVELDSTTLLRLRDGAVAVTKGGVGLLTSNPSTDVSFAGRIFLESSVINCSRITVILKPYYNNWNLVLNGCEI